MLALLVALTATALLPIAACLLVCVVAHEIGHLVAGLLVRWEFRYFIAGPLAISKEAGGLKLRLVYRRILGGGLVLMVPRGLDSRLRRNQLVVIAGGPVTTAAVFIPVLMLPWNQFTVSLCVANAVVAIGSWTPMTIGGWATDARLFIRFARAPSESLEAISQLRALDHKGTEPRNWPPDQVNLLSQRTDDHYFGAVARQVRYLYVRECADSQVAAIALESVLTVANRLTPDERRGYFSEAAFFQGVFRRNSTLAKEWLEDARRIKVSLPGREWEDYPLAAIAVAEGQSEKAHTYFLGAIRTLDRAPGNSGSLAALRARLMELMA